MRAWLTKFIKSCFHFFLAPLNKLKIRGVGRCEKLSINDKFNKTIESLFFDFYEENRNHILYLKKNGETKEIKDLAIETISTYVWMVKTKYDLINRINEIYNEIDDMMGDGYEDVIKLNDSEIQAKYGKRTLVTVKGMIQQIERLTQRKNDRYQYRIKWILDNWNKFNMLERAQGK